ncbi:hypothetical protein DRB17_05525 [Ferruginivarius sediminum]|uniref:Terminase large subunit gp17-like C-terminal domain-containing protein n=1 Tax=Ferruginivarius sediminum TaxID=2661937 RepID=A0A369TC42_9PROT|nr:hypothetical protein DRB17_05525 [Ferruginivarius sediminum]
MVEKTTRNVGNPDKPEKKHTFAVRYLERLPLGTPYPSQCEHVADLAGRLERQHQEDWRVDRPEVVIDQTGVGRAVFDIFAGAGLKPLGVTITAGEGESKVQHDHYRVAKLSLVSRLQALLHSGDLSIEPSLKDTKALVSELQNFRARFTTAGNAVFAAREGTHDDLVLSVAIACWHAARPESVFTVRRTKGF